MNQPDLDRWTTAFALIAFLGLFLAPLLLTQAGQQKHQIRYVVAILILFSVVLVYYVLYWSNYLQFFSFLIVPVKLLFFLFGVLFYLYLKELFHQPVSPRAKLIHFLPFLIALGLHLIRFVVLRTPVTSLVQSSFLHDYYKALPWLILTHLSLYAIAIIRLQDLFKTLEGVTRWARWFSLCYLGFVLANWSYHLLVPLPFLNRAWDYGISFSIVGFIGLVAVLAYVQPHLFQTNPLPVSELTEQLMPTPHSVQLKSSNNGAIVERYLHSGLPAHLASQFAQQLDQLMRTERLYQDSSLRLDTVAERIKLNRHQLSQVINEQLGMNFFEYVNSLRVDEAKELLSQATGQQLIIIDIAYKVGFNNKVSFNKSFKNSTGLTPTEFRRQVQDKFARTDAQSKSES